MFVILNSIFDYIATSYDACVVMLSPHTKIVLQQEQMSHNSLTCNDSQFSINCDCGGSAATISASIFVSVLLASLIFIILQILLPTYRSKLTSCCERKQPKSSIGTLTDAEDRKETQRDMTKGDSLKVLRAEAAKKGAERGMGYGDVLTEGGGINPPLAFERNTAYVPHILHKK